MALGHLFDQLLFVLLLCSDVAAGCNDDLTITTPSPMEALRGSCLNIPCTYRPKKGINAASPFIGIWSKNAPVYRPTAPNVISVSGVRSKSYPMNITGNLKKKDCTTMFYNLTPSHQGKYFFRIENGGKKATAICTYLQITVTDKAWTPSLHVSGNQRESEVVTITCSAVTPCPHAPPQLTWDLLKGTAVSKIIETNTDRTITTKTKLNLTLTDSHDGLMITCSAAYPVSGGVKTVNNSIPLSVTYGPKNTSVWVSSSGSLSDGQSVTLRCSSRAKPPVQTFTWFRHSSQGPVFVGEGDTYTFNFTKDEDFYCEVSNGLKIDSSSVIHLGITEEIGRVPWEAILGAGFGVLTVLVLAVVVWCFKRKQQEEIVKGEEETIHRGEMDFSKLDHKEASNNNEDSAVKEETVYSQVQVSQAKPKAEETILYGELDFSKLSHKVVPEKEKEETVYSQIQVSKLVDNSGQYSGDSLYANVKKK